MTASSPNLLVASSARTAATGSQVHLSASNPANGAAPAVRWTVVASDNAAALGSGSIDATGLYTAPGALSADEITVTLSATLAADPAQSTSTVLTLTPGFAQPLSPENAAVAPGESLEVTAKVAEVNAGTVSWSLQPSPGAAAAAGAGLGTLIPGACTRAPRQFTTCTAIYTAPPTSTPTPGPPSAQIIATANHTGPSTSLHLLLNTGLTSNPATHQAQQTGPVLLGSSGGNDNDFDTYADNAGTASAANYIADCCGGTLGALVQDQSGQKYILSNNHVLAESDQAHPGDTIVQPGTIDDACVPLSSPGAKVRAVGSLRASVPLDAPATNVDAALAAVAPGAIDPSGAILELGAQTTTAQGTALAAAAPVAGTGEALNAANLGGIEVVKSGRTTGLTCSTVNSIDLAVKVDYYRDCAETQPYTTKIFTGQIGIPGNSFSDAGDSGALVVDAANAQPVGLFYAGSTTPNAADADSPGLSIANPIGDVLSALGARVGSSLSIVGAASQHRISCLNYEGSNAPAADDLASLVPAERARAREAARAAQSLVSSEKGILGVAPGVSSDRSGEGAVLVYVDRSRSSMALPANVNGVRTVLVATDAATLSRSSAPAVHAEEGIRLAAPLLAEASRLAHEYSSDLLADPAIFGVGVTQSLDNPREAALMVLLDSSKPEPAALLELDPGSAGRLPATLGGMRVRYLKLHRFRVTRAKNSTTLSSCQLRARTASSAWSPTRAAEQRSLQLH